MEKESLSIMTVKILLAVIIFTGMGTIIVGGGYLIMSVPKTDLPITNPIIETQCEVDSDCLMAFVPAYDYICPSCDISSEEYQCLTMSEIKKLKNRGEQKDESVLCSPCPLEFDRYVCECKNGKCEKVKKDLVEDVSITTDKTEYEIGETVEITIINNKSEAIYFYPYCFPPYYSISRLEKNDWNLVDQNCECEFMCDDGTLISRPKIVKEYSLHFFEFESPQAGKWKQKECVSKKQMCGDESYTAVIEEQAEAGKYKISFCYLDKKDVGPKRLLAEYTSPDKKKCIESEFTIKEKTALDTSNWQTYRNEELGFEFRYPFEYPDGNNIIIKDVNQYIVKILNYECLEEIHGMYCDRNRETKNDFFIELLNLNNIKGKNSIFQPEKDFEEYEGIKKFGDNEFYVGYNYGPSTANVYVYKNNTNVRISFYDNYSDKLISGILSSFKFIEK